MRDNWGTPHLVTVGQRVMAERLLGQPAKSAVALFLFLLSLPHVALWHCGSGGSKQPRKPHVVLAEADALLRTIERWQE